MAARGEANYATPLSSGAALSLVGATILACGTGSPSHVPHQTAYQSLPARAARVTQIDWPEGIEATPPPTAEAVACATHSSVAWHFERSSAATRINLGREERRQTDPLPGPPLPRFVLVNAFDSDGGNFDYFFGRGDLLPSAVTPVRDGYLFGFDMGEWSGSLWWRDIAGDQHERIARGLNVKAILKSSDGASIVIDGTSHLMLREGAATRLRKDAGTWQKLGELQLNHEPTAWFQMEKSTLVIAAGSTINWIDEETMSPLALVQLPEIEDSFLRSSSIAPAPNDTVVLAFPYYLLSVDPRGNRTWYAPKEGPSRACCHCGSGLPV